MVGVHVRRTDFHEGHGVLLKQEGADGHLGRDRRGQRVGRVLPAVHQVPGRGPRHRHHEEGAEGSTTRRGKAYEKFKQFSDYVQELQIIFKFIVFYDLYPYK